MTYSTGLGQCRTLVEAPERQGEEITDHNVYGNGACRPLHEQALRSRWPEGAEKRLLYSGPIPSRTDRWMTVCVTTIFLDASLAADGTG